MISNAEYATTNLTLQPPIWGPRIIYGGTIVVVIAGLISLIGVLATRRLQWTGARHLAVSIVALVCFPFGSYSLIRLRYNMEKSINMREARSVYIIFSSAAPSAAGTKSNMDFSAFSTKKATSREKQCLRKLSRMSWATIIIGFCLGASSFWFGATQLQSSDTYEAQAFNPIEEIIAWVRLAGLGILVYYASP
uniref:Uncharacterized protein n=1 Tax=Lotharella oceanica TaxID=641309 RepID=A0A7S2U2I6_9EUKA|mmetsp:Transcript_5177/g.10265  ORF Transcript_5177/g.10265 Transcript_5177/m.10265 type:complete len:193 (+) Transcript_5177:292-870(+)